MRHHPSQRGTHVHTSSDSPPCYSTRTAIVNQQQRVETRGSAAAGDAAPGLGSSLGSRRVEIHRQMRNAFRFAKVVQRYKVYRAETRGEDHHRARSAASVVRLDRRCPTSWKRAPPPTSATTPRRSEGEEKTTAAAVSGQGCASPTAGCRSAASARLRFRRSGTAAARSSPANIEPIGNIAPLSSTAGASRSSPRWTSDTPPKKSVRSVSLSGR